MSYPWLTVLVLALVVGGWFAWRYFRLRSRVAALASDLRQDNLADVSAESPELRDLARSANALISGFRSRSAMLAGERDRLAAVFSQMADGVLIADDNGRIEMANPAARRLFDYPEPITHSVTEVVRNHQLVAAWRRCRETKALQSESVEIPGRRQFLQLIAVPDQHAGGSLLLVQDLTRVRRLETVRRDFVSNISHELRTPLASLRALTETLQDGAFLDPNTAPQFLGQMIKEVDALTQMAQELLDLSRIESGQVELAFARIAPCELLESAAARMKMQVERAGVSLQVACPSNLPDLSADGPRLEQVLVNLIHNAVKFSGLGGEVVLSAELEDPRASVAATPGARAMMRLSVKDTGIGIPADDLPRIFERFYQVDKARAGKGTGLGLSIARHIVEAHGGRIWAESTEGQGSTFFFTLPVSR